MVGQEGNACLHFQFSREAGNLKPGIEVGSELSEGGMLPGFWELEDIGTLDFKEQRRLEHRVARGVHVEVRPGTRYQHAPGLCFIWFGLVFS